MSRIHSIVGRVFCAAAICVSLSSLAVGQSTLLNDNFEGYALNSWPTGWHPDGNAGSDSSRNKIVLDPTDSTNQVLQMYGVVGSYWGALAYHPVDFPDAFTTSFSVYNGSETLGPGGHKERTGMGMRHGTYWYGATNPGRGFLQFKGNGTVTDGNGDVVQSYNTNQWYNVSVDYLRLSDSVNLSYRIDGQNRGQVSIPLSTWDPPVDKPLNHFEFNVQAGSAYYDNAKVTPWAQLGPSTDHSVENGGIGLRETDPSKYVIVQKENVMVHFAPITTGGIIEIVDIPRDVVECRNEAIQLYAGLMADVTLSGMGSEYEAQFMMDIPREALVEFYADGYTAEDLHIYHLTSVLPSVIDPLNPITLPGIGYLPRSGWTDDIMDEMENMGYCEPDTVINHWGFYEDHAGLHVWGNVESFSAYAIGVPVPEPTTLLLLSLGGLALRKRIR